MNFSGKVAIVTGGALGIGKAISSTLLDMGMKLCICDINGSAAQEFIEKVPDDSKANVTCIECDVSSPDEFRAVFEKTQKMFGRIDVLINNAGIMDEFQWKKVVEVNFVGVIYGIQLAFEFMGKDNGGSGGFVINTGSNAGLEPFYLAPVYSGCKHGVIGLTKSYGKPYYYEKTGITVNAVCPGPVDTQMSLSFPNLVIDKEKAEQHMLNIKPINASEVAKAVVKLLQDGQNGALLRVDKDGVRYVQ